MLNSLSFCLVSISCGSIGLTGGSLFSTVSKCSFQIFSLSLCSFVGFPFLSLTTVLVVFFSPVKVFTIRCSSPALPFSAALPAISAISFIQYLLYSQALRLTSWSFPLYSSFILFLTLSERVLSNFNFSCFLSSTFFHVPSRNLQGFVFRYGLENIFFLHFSLVSVLV